MKGLDAVGWAATAAFSLSYLMKGSRTLRWVQAGAALIWIAYGAMLHAMPVVVANSVVAIAALASSFRAPRDPLPTS